VFAIDSASVLLVLRDRFVEKPTFGSSPRAIGNGRLAVKRVFLNPMEAAIGGRNLAAVQEFQLNLHRLAIHIAEEFTYLDTAACSGTTYAERKHRRDAYWERCDPRWGDGPGCESFAGFLQRLGWLEQTLNSRRPEDTVVVFTHEFVMRALRWLQQHTAERLRVRNVGDKCLLSQQAFQGKMQRRFAAFAINNPPSFGASQIQREWKFRIALLGRRRHLSGRMASVSKAG
jgi:hypothetical protein